jgi:hypothetical protein
MLSRGERRPSVQVWPIQIWDRLPIIPVPLREPDPDAAIDLSAHVASAYDDGGYDLLIDYCQPPPPPDLTPDEAAWIEQELKARGRRE